MFFSDELQAYDGLSSASECYAQCEKTALAQSYLNALSADIASYINNKCGTGQDSRQGRCIVNLYQIEPNYDWFLVILGP